ncbi:MAG: dNTP triphosphohydrolase [Bacteroidales bacterium]|nr:dNTP triphosphohydrolase [Bacteroidales bacterium]
MQIKNYLQNQNNQYKIHKINYILLLYNNTIEINMNWNSLLNSERLGDIRKDYDNVSYRSAFQRDFDRIIFSSAFRRMQDKTQVFPVPESDFVHNRLTHSLEVAMVGRSLGNIAGDFILSKEPELKEKFTMNIFGDIVAAAALAHDLGNPPFGHNGEDAIGDFFSKNDFIKLDFNLNDSQWKDFIKYEGNAAGFRLLVNHHPAESNSGMRLTYATLATFAKYPRPSLIETNKIIDSSIKRTSSKKFSFFNSELELFKQTADKTGLVPLSADNTVFARHPLAFLVESADNICYRIIDLEDGYNLGYLSITDIEELLIPLMMRSNNSESSLKQYKAIIDNGEKVGYLRAVAISVLISETKDVFEKNYEKIMSGEFDTELTDLIKSVDLLEGPIKASNIFLYQRKPVIEIELAGYEVIYGLLEKFMQIYLQPNHILSKKLLRIMPTQFHSLDRDSNYCKLMKVVDFIARMTDSYALNLYRRLSGQSLPTV